MERLHPERHEPAAPDTSDGLGKNDNLPPGASQSTPGAPPVPAAPPPIPPPAPPLAPPPPPPKSIPTSDEPVKHRVPFVEQDLQIAASKLKKVKKNFDPVVVNHAHLIDNFTDLPEHDHFPIIHAQYAIQSMLLTRDLVTLDFSGIDQLTDAFFRVLDSSDISLPSLTSIKCNGCHYLTDYAIGLPLFSGLLNASFNFCRNLTGKSVASLLTNCPLMTELSMKATNVSVLPQHIVGSHGVSISLSGCPLVTPTVDKYAKYGRIYFREEAMKELGTMNEFKIVIISPADLGFSVGQYLVNGTKVPLKNPLQITQDWAPSHPDLNGTKFHIFEVKDGQVIEDLFLSEDCICILPYMVKLNTGALIGRLSQLVYGVTSKAPGCAILLLGVTDDNTSNKTQDENGSSGYRLQHMPPKGFSAEVEKGVKKSVQKVADFLRIEYMDMTRRRWKIFGWDFPDQQIVGRLSAMDKAFIDQHEKIFTGFLDLETESLDGIFQALKMALETLSWNDPHSLEFLQLREKFPRHLISPFDEVYSSLPRSARKGLPLRSCLKASEILFFKGICLVYPEISDCPLLSDLAWFEEVLTIILQPPRSDKGRVKPFVKCLSDSVPRWTEKELVQQFTLRDLASEKEVLQVLRLLEKKNVLLRLPCERDSEADERYVYILYDKLQHEPSIPLVTCADYFWPDDRPEGDIQKDRFYSFMHGMPASFMSALIRHCAKVTRLTLLWTNGFLIQCGAVDLLIELLGGIRFDFILVVSARSHPPPGGSSEATLQCIWSVLNTYTAIVDYVVKKFNIFAKVAIPCETCAKSQNRKKMVFDKGVIYTPLLTAKAGWDRSLICKGYCTGKRFTKEEMLGPDYKRLTPMHDHSFVQQTKKDFTSYSRCFMCQNCAQDGIFCASNGLPGETARHCGCKTELTLCPKCGVCPKCTAFLAKVEKTLDPALSSMNPVWVPESSKTVVRGNIFQCVTGGFTMNCPYVMSPEHFNYFEIVLLRGNSITVTLNSEVGEPAMSYGVSVGQMFVGMEERLNKAACAGHQGDIIAFKLQYRKDSWGRMEMEKEPEIQVIRNREVLFTASMKNSHLLVDITVLQPVALIMNVPNILSNKRRPQTSLEGFEIGQLLEVEGTSTEPFQVLNTSSGDGKLQEVWSPEHRLMRVKEVTPETLKLTPVQFEGYNEKGPVTIMSDTEDITVSKDILYGSSGSYILHPLGYAASMGQSLVVRVTDDSGLTTSTRMKMDQIPGFNLDQYLTTQSLVPYRSFTQIQTGGCVPHPSLYQSKMESDCSGFLVSPVALQCHLAQILPQLEYHLFQKGHMNINLTGAAAVLLPASVDKLAPDYPTRLSLKWLDRLRLHPLCYVRGDCGEILLLSPKYDLLAESRPYWDAHFLDAEGIAPPGDILENAQWLLLAWHAILSLHKEISLPDMDKFVLPSAGEHENRLTKGSKWIHSNLQLYTSIMSMLLVDNGHLLVSKLSDTDNLQAAAQYLSDLVLENEAQTGLLSSQTMLDMEQIWICDAHKSCLQTQSQLANFSLNSFSKYVKFLRSINFSDNDIEELPEDFFLSLSGLVDLNFSQNKLRHLPRGIGVCKQLRYVHLCENRLEDLPEDLADAESLLRLDISSNPMKKVPDVVIKMTKLHKLYVQKMLLSELPANIGNMSSLQLIHASGNCLRSLPASMKNLKEMRFLGLNGIPWCEVKANSLLTRDQFESFLENANLISWLEEHPEEKAFLFEQFGQDTNGMLDEKEIGKLNAKLFSMFPRLGTNGAGRKGNIGGFPSVIFALEKLEYLSMQYQGLTEVPDAVGWLKTVTEVNLSHNPLLRSLSAKLGSLPLKRLELDDCPSLRTPPKEIRAKGFHATYAYLRRLQTGSVPCKRTKLMLVGLGGAGKTSLVKALLSGSNKGHTEGPEAVTDGIDISTWTITKESDGVTFSVWDFAGQTVYYNTHQFFISNRAVYLLLWNVRLGFEHAGLYFWLSSISVHAPKAPIFVVGTHVDQVSKWDIPMEEMRKRFPQIAGYHFVSSYTGKGIASLQDNILDVALQQPYMGERIPEVWLNFENAVVSKRSEASVIQYTDLEKLALNSGIFDKSEVGQAVQFLHELGALQHFTHEFLRDRVVIDPQWIVDVMACVVSVKDSPIEEGRLYHRDVGRIWRDYPEHLHQWLLRLTEEFDLTFPLVNEELNLVPCLMPEKQPEFDWPVIDKDSNLRETKMIYKFAYLPAGLFNRGQVRLYQFSDSSVIWKRGSLLRKNNHMALLTQTKESEMIVKVQGPRPENVLFLVHEVFEGLISEAFQGTSYDYMLPCPDCLKAVSRNPHMFAASTIRKATELKAPFLQCIKSFHNVSLTDLHAVMPPDSSQDYDIHLANAVRNLTDLRKDLTADIFVSYCPLDMQRRAKNEVNPETIKNDLIKAGFRCWFPGVNEDQSVEQMALAMRDAEIFMAIISDNYVNDKNCCDTFLYARVTLKKPLLLVVVGPPGDAWKKSKLGLLVSDDVYVDMHKAERYDNKLKELLKQIQDRSSKHDQTTSLTKYPPCFVSYSWQNSHNAIALGTRLKSNSSLGHTDPRDVKRHLEENGIQCWIDVEQVGRNGLFADIAGGLQHAKVAVACVSDEYALSPNCVMEFRFALKVLNIPMILAEVGTGTAWRGSEVGMLSLQLPLVSFQEKSDTAGDKLLQLVTEHLPEEGGGEAQQEKSDKNDSNQAQKNVSFQELYELAQRKFLRQVTNYADSAEEVYPRLIVIDFLEMLADQQKAESEKQQSETRDPQPQKPPLTRKASSAVLRSNAEPTFRHKGFGFKILCEHEQGWHNYSDPIDAPTQFSDSSLAKFSPYLARITALLKHSTSANLNCVTGQPGEQFLKWLTELPQAASSDFSGVYQELRQEVIKADQERAMGQLSRCHLPSGKTIWLCPEHQKMTRVTVLTNDIVLGGGHSAPDSTKNNYMLAELAVQQTAKRFQDQWLDPRVTEEQDEEIERLMKRQAPGVSGQSESKTSATPTNRPVQPTKKKRKVQMKNSPIDGAGAGAGATTASPEQLGRADKQESLPAILSPSTAANVEERRDRRSKYKASVRFQVDEKDTGDVKLDPEFHARAKFKAAGIAAAASAKVGKNKSDRPSSKACAIL